MKRCTFIVLLFVNLLPAFAQETEVPLNVYYGEIPDGERTFFVAPDGDNASAGTEQEPWATLDHAVTRVQRGDVIVMRGGVYDHDDIVRIESPSGFTDDLIVVTAYPGEVPVLDFSGQPKVRNYHGIRLNANWWHIIGITIRNASHNGIRIDGSYNVLEQVTSYGNHDSGIHMAGGASNNLIKNCDSFHNFNYDPARTPRIGNNADGFSAKFDIGPGNVYEGCRSWENSDDGFDFWEAESTIEVNSSWAFGNGDASVFGDPADFEGNGNGFKLGGNFVAADHIVRRSMAFDNFGSSGNAKGFDYNNNPGAMTLIHNTAYNNGRNYYFPLDPPDDGQAVFLNNLSAVTSLHALTPPGAVVAGNSWQAGTEITVDMFLSVDTETAKGLRETDGSLPRIDLLKPAPGSFPVDAAVVIAEPFYGTAPDMGVYEYAEGSEMQPWVERGPGTVADELRVFDLEHAGQWSLTTESALGAQAYGGSDATISSIPVEIAVDEWIRVAADSRTRNYLFPAAEMTLVRPGTVFVAHSNDIATKPGWLADFTETALGMNVTEPGGGEREMTVYRRDVTAGEVVNLGRNSRDGTSDAPMYVVMIGRVLSVASEEIDAPEMRTELHEVYPNPVGRSATISFSLERGSDVSVRIYDALGREVAELAAGYHGPGSHTYRWDARSMASGVYFCRLEVEGLSLVKKLLRTR